MSAHPKPWREQAECRVCGKQISVVGPFYDPTVAYFFKEATYGGHHIIAPGHWGYNYYYIHEDRYGNVLRAVLIPLRFHSLIKEGVGELKGKVVEDRRSLVP